MTGVLITQVTDNGSGYAPEFDLLRRKMVGRFQRQAKTDAAP
jgi:hypothetical protein